MENNKLCKLCYNSDKQIIKIFDDEGNETKIVKIIKKHFWFKVTKQQIKRNTFLIVFNNFTDLFYLKRLKFLVI